MSMIRSSNDDNGPEIQLIKTRGTSVGSVTKPNQNDYLGAFVFLAGDDSDLFTRGAEIGVQATGTPANDRVPSDILFATTPTSGATAPQQRLRINSQGSVIINGTTSFGDPVKLQVRGASSAISDGAQIFDVASTAASNGGTRLAFGVNEDNYTWIRSYESAVGGRDMVFAASAEKMRIDGGAYARIGINTSTFDTAGYQIKIDGSRTGTTSPPYLQIKGVGNANLHS